MFNKRWTACIRSAFVFISVAGLMSACSPSNYPFFQPQSGFRYEISVNVSPPLISETDSLPVAAPLKETAPPVGQQSEMTTTSPAAVFSALPPKPRISQQLSRNPDVAQKPRHGVFAWKESVQYAEKKLTPAERKAFNKTRRIPTLNWIALGGSLIPYAILILALTSGFAWAAGMVFSLGSVLAGIAGLTKISRNPEKYRGKGWAISGILLATGFMGIALLALAALSTSRVIWE
ncbi:hypothetical protein GCM10023189_59800 [Nibrella saemangeumensis]|uniref:DUF4190 domain-containing protein n=1 Tax=Nibrella saemangeumensis TaxID=1084526 RepID=A0ABP8NSP3_9BACT